MAANELEKAVEEAPPQLPVTDHQRELATQAMNEFERWEWTNCSATMARLAEARPTDFKVVLNRSVLLFQWNRHDREALEELKHNIQTVFNMARISPDLTETTNLDDADYAVVYYNKALILAMEKQYRAALSLLEKLFRYIEPVDEAVTQRVMLLMTELYLIVHQPYDAMRMAVTMEKSLSGMKSVDKDKDKEKTEGVNKIRIDELKNQLTLLKIRCNLMAKLAKNKKEYESLDRGTPAARFVKIYYEFLRGNFKTLGKPRDILYYQTGSLQCLSAMEHNHHAVISMAQGRPNTAICQIRAALRDHELLAKEKAITDKATPDFALLYNLGVLQLHSKRPVQAFDCLVECVHIYHRNPRLWLRLAECCLMHMREDNNADRRHQHKNQIIQSSVGGGFHHKLILGQGVAMDNGERKTPERGNPSLSVGYARFCLKNAMGLLPTDPLDSKPIVADEQNEACPLPTDPVLIPAEPANPLRETEVANLRCSILAASAYVSLCEDDYYMALAHASNLLRQPLLSPAQRYLGHMYKGEALVALNRIADAVDELRPEEVNNVSTVIPDLPEEHDKDQEPIVFNRESLVEWVPSNATVAQGMMQYNLAVAYAMRTEYDRAQKALNQSIDKVGTPLPAQMFYLRIYLSLKQGNRQGAFSLISEHFAHFSRK